MLSMGRTFPERTKEIPPVCSLTTTTSASLCSEIPTAALCLMPKRAGRSERSVMGRVQRAAMMRSSPIIIAPSCSGEFL